jgi:uncharacterized protein involved in outer membrane biogenesis
MKNLHKRWRLAVFLVLAVVAAQICASVAAKTHRVHNFLVGQLEHSFGRHVEVDYFSVTLLPVPMLDSQRVTIGEDPSFGNEYFLRADHLTVTLRWTGLLLGRFEFGTVSLDKPSLILTRNLAGKWNLENWLPPDQDAVDKAAHVYGPRQTAAQGNFLREINVDEGRINFKIGDEKLPFAFIAVTGTVDQVTAGRWQLRLKAEPWRSGVQLQSPGIVSIAGDIAGTSARLRPAELSVHWDKASLADIFRMVDGADLGVRGEFTLDATAKSGVVADDATSAPGTPQRWAVAVAARGTRIHRWDLTDRDDNPRVNIFLNGQWNSSEGVVLARELKVEGPKSNLRGTAKFSAALTPAWDWQVDSAGIQATDILAWYRAFHGGVDDRVTAEQFFTGAMHISGWPITLQAAAFSSAGGIVTIAGIDRALRVSAMRGGTERDKFTVEPLTISVDENSSKTAVSLRAPMPAAKRAMPASATKNLLELTMTEDLTLHSGVVSVTGRVEEVADALTVSAAVGHKLNYGWDMHGPVAGALSWAWNSASPRGQWNGTATVSGAVLQAAGLNLPIQAGDVRLQWKNGKRMASIGTMAVLGANWSGEIAETSLPGDPQTPRWNFKLHGDHLNATELDRWIGPRARPGWLSNLLPALLRDNTPKALPTELLQQLNAEGEMRVDELTIERLSLRDLRTQISMRDLHLEVKDAQARWAGGTVRGKLRGVFAPAPKYEVAAELQDVDLAQIPAGHLTNAFAGTGSASIQLTAEGVGREQLLQKLAAHGRVRLNHPEFRLANVTQHATDTEAPGGISSWASGQGAFSVAEKSIKLEGLQLDGENGRTIVRGNVKFSREANLRAETRLALPGSNAADPVPAPAAVQITGTLDAPKITFDNLQARKSTD